MNKKSEAKLLNEFIQILDDPERAGNKFMRYAKTAIFVSMLLIFFCFSNGLDAIENRYYFALCAFLSGVSFGLGLWFLQGGTQTRIMARHMSRDSINRRMDEINL